MGTRTVILVAVVHLAVRNLILPRTTGTASRQPLGIPTGAAVIMMEKLKRAASQLKCISKLLGTLMELKRVLMWVPIITAVKAFRMS